MGKVFIDPTNRFDEVHRVVRVFFDTSANSEYVWVKDNICRIKADNFSQDPIGAFADFDFASVAISLAVLIECHHNNRCAKASALSSLFYKALFAFLEAD